MLTLLGCDGIMPLAGKLKLVVGGVIRMRFSSALDESLLAPSISRTAGSGEAPGVGTPTLVEGDVPNGASCAKTDTVDQHSVARTTQ